MVREGNFDLVLMDIQMPVMGGLEATREIRKNKSFTDLPIIAMTAHAMAGDREKSIEAGMNDHVTKPINPDELISVILKWIKPGDRDLAALPLANSGEILDTECFLPDTLEGISVKSGLSRVAGNRQLYIKLLCNFKAGYSDSTERIGLALKDHDQETAVRLAHTVKGISGNLGAERLYQVSGKLEKSIKEENDLEPLISEFDQCLKQVMNGITPVEINFRSTESCEDPDERMSINIPEVKTLLQETAKLLETDLDEAILHVQNLRGHLIHSSVHEQFMQLEKHVENFDTDIALETVQTIAKMLEIDL